MQISILQMDRQAAILAAILGISKEIKELNL